MIRLSDIKGGFLSTPSARRATGPVSVALAAGGISIHALREEGDRFSRITKESNRYFYPRPPRGGRPDKVSVKSNTIDFYPRPPRGGRLSTPCRGWKKCVISIHALREEGDFPPPRGGGKNPLFLSTPSARRATLERLVQFIGQLFLSTPSARRATFVVHTVYGGRHNISIHALREEGDFGAAPAGCVASYFYPRPPRGGRPMTYHVALTPTNFYPRPPRGGRRAPFPRPLDRQRISIHALREEGDLSDFG